MLDQADCASEGEALMNIAQGPERAIKADFDEGIRVEYSAPGDDIEVIYMSNIVGATPPPLIQFKMLLQRSEGNAYVVYSLCLLKVRAVLLDLVPPTKLA